MVFFSGTKKQQDGQRSTERELSLSKLTPKSSCRLVLSGNPEGLSGRIFIPRSVYEE